VTPWEIIIALLGSNALSAGVTAWATRRPSMLGAFTQAYVQLAARVAQLEKRVTELDGKLDAEQEAHDETRGKLVLERDAHVVTTGKLRRLLAWVRLVLAWSESDRSDLFPEVPVDVKEQLI
jgi:hypothetical protein